MQNISTKPSVSPQLSKAQQIFLSYANILQDSHVESNPRKNAPIAARSVTETTSKSDLDYVVTEKERKGDQSGEVHGRDTDLEATFKELRLLSTEEAFTALSDRQGSATLVSSSSCGSRSTPRNPSSNLLTPTIAYNSATGDIGVSESKSGDTSTNELPKRTVRPLSQLDVSELIYMKISQLESVATSEEDEEKEIAKAMKRIHKEISQAVNGQEDHLGKVNFMQRKYLEMFQEMRKQERDHIKLKKRSELLQREKDLLHREKERLQKSNDLLTMERSQHLEERRIDELSIVKLDNLCLKLEDLCRQIYQENRRIKRAIVQFKEKVEQDIAERQRQTDENNSILQDKFEGLLEQYDVREKHYNSVVKSKDLELELAQAKLEKQQERARQESAKVELLKPQLSTFTKTEAELRKQLNVYVEKFKQVEETLNKSNSLFQSFRKEIEVMSKKGTNLERVNSAIRSKCDTMNRNILEMAEERSKHQQALDAANKNRTKLEALCRALHSEKSALRKSLDIYEARYPGLADEAIHTISSHSEGWEENGIQEAPGSKVTTESVSTHRTAEAEILFPTTGTIEETTLTSTVIEISTGGVATATKATSLTTALGGSLSAQNVRIKQNKPGGRRQSTSSGKLRQKQKQQHLQMLLQRCEQSASIIGAATKQAEQHRQHGQKPIVDDRQRCSDKEGADDYGNDSIINTDDSPQTGSNVSSQEPDYGQNQFQSQVMSNDTLWRCEKVQEVL
ncbi:hypothetical protein BGX27_000293 [Mortierella sp. AM989]|nr:hypothetical protein BGX27_000293 [Mortierella sp. AM989]